MRDKLQQWTSALHALKTAPLKPYLGLVTFSAVSLALAIGITLSRTLVFEYHSSAGVVGWLSANAYPKQQEYFFYLLALLGVPATVFLYAGGWCLFSRWCAARTHQPVHRVLKANGLASLPLWLCWLQVYPTTQGTLFLLLPLGASVVCKAILRWQHYFPTLRVSNTPDTSDTGQNGSEVSNADVNGTAETVSAASSHPSSDSSAVVTFLRRGLHYILLPIFIYLLNYSAHIHGNIDMFHEGERLAPLNEMFHGGVPFRDIYVQHGLFQNVYLARVGAALFEPTLLGVRSMERVLDPLGYVSLYLLGLQVFRWQLLTTFLCLLISSGTSFFVSPRHSLGLVAFAWVASFLKTESSGSERGQVLWRLVLAGCFTNFAFWYSTEVGLYTLGAIGLFLVLYALRHRPSVWQRLAPVVTFSCGVLFSFLAVSLYFFSHGALDDAIWNSYIQCRYQLATWGLAFPSLTDTLAILSADGWHAFVFSERFRWYLPVCVFVGIAAYLTYRALSGKVPMVLLLLLLGGVAFFRTALGRSDGGHLIYGATFLWVLCLFLLEGGVFRLYRACVSVFRGDRTLRPVLRSAWVLIPVAVCWWYVGSVHQPLAGFRGKWQRLRQNPFTQSLGEREELWRAGRVDIPDAQAAHIGKVVAYIQENTAADEKIFDFTSQGSYYFFADRPSVTRFHQISYASTPAMQREVVAALEADGTRLVIFKTGGWFDAVDGISVEERHPLVAAYLMENYEPAITIGQTEILLRKGER